VLTATVLTCVTETSLQRNEGLPALTQTGSWLVLGATLVTVLYAEATLFDLLFTLFLCLGAPYVMLSVS
jgi:hypothetical protein